MKETCVACGDSPSTEVARFTPNVLTDLLIAYKVMKSA